MVTQVKSDVPVVIPPKQPEDGERKILSEDSKLDQVLTQFSSVFCEKIGRTSTVTHRIDTGQAPSCHQGPYPCAPARKAVIKEQIDEMLQLGVIERSVSPWAAPVVLVEKKRGDKRFCRL